MQITLTKCDRCHEPYDPKFIAIVDDDVVINGEWARLSLAYSAKEGTLFPLKQVDLCPGCRTALADWWDK